MKRPKLIVLLFLALIFVVAITRVATRVPSERDREADRIAQKHEAEKAIHNVSQTFVPDTSPPHFSK